MASKCQRLRATAGICPDAVVVIPPSAYCDHSKKHPGTHQYCVRRVPWANSLEKPTSKKKPPGGGFVKVPEGTSLEPFEASLLVGFTSILVNCDSS
jgi:hypothetical protein